MEREGIDVEPENPFIRLILYLGRRYMNWRYSKPDASINKEIILLLVLISACFVQFFYVTLILKAQVSIQLLYASIGFFVVGSILLIIFLVIYKRRCPNCRGYFGIETIDSKLVDEKEVYQTETEIKMRKIFRNTYRCVFCGHSYTRNEPQEEIIQKETLYL